MWYGKGPGVDRCGDVFKHANAAGSARHGGVLLLRRRRPYGQVVHARPPVRIHLHGRQHPGAAPGRRPGVPRSRPLRLGDEPLFRLLGRLQDDRRHGGELCHGLGRSGAHPDRDARGLRDARGRPQHPLARRAPGAGRAPASAQALCGPRLCPAPTSSTACCARLAEAPLRHRHHRQVLSSTSCRRSTISGSMPRKPRRSA